VAEQSQEIRRFERAATQRLTAASLLLEHSFNLESTYLAGYAVECSLKALILKRTPRRQFPATLMRLTRVGAKGHDFEYLKSILRRPPVNCSIPVHVNELLMRVASWTTAWRYAVGLVERKDAERFLRSAEGIRGWAVRS
jgi:HEPN domain-containing protein